MCTKGTTHRNGKLSRSLLIYFCASPLNIGTRDDFLYLLDDECNYFQTTLFSIHHSKGTSFNPPLVMFRAPW